MTSKDCQANAFAHPNIALIKYWGKASDLQYNEPAVSSLSITLDTLVTDTHLHFSDDFDQDILVLNGEVAPNKLGRISANLDKLRILAGVNTRCRISTKNNFPTSAGLASSASGFAALVAAANHALNIGLSSKQQTMMARSMSGSAARSIYGGFVKLFLPEAAQHTEHFGRAFAEQFEPCEHWPLEVCVGIISEQEKAIGSTEGMERSRLTSPYYQSWLDHNDTDVLAAEQAIQNKDFQRLAELSEQSCLKMHAMAMASNPGLLYWHGATMTAMHVIRDLRAKGVPVFFTIDAGPQIKAVCDMDYGKQVAEVLSNVAGIQRVIQCGLGGNTRVTN